jgi:hypothetical protein
MQSKAKQSKAKQSKAKQSTCFALLLETGSGHLIQSHEPITENKHCIITKQST